MSQDIVIGHRVSDLFYALETDSYVVLTGSKPREHEGNLEQNSEKMWCQLYWDLFFRNKIYPGKVLSIAIDSSKKVIVLSTGSGNKEYLTFKKCFVCCPSKVTFEDFSLMKVEKSLYQVTDYYEANSHSYHDLSLLEIGDKFVSLIKFYVTSRIDGNKAKKDFVVISYLTEEQLRDFNYSDTMVSFKVKDILSTELNVSRLKISHIHREVHPMMDFEILYPASQTCIKRKSLQTLTKKDYDRYRKRHFR